MKSVMRHLVICLFVFISPLYAQNETPVLTDADWGSIVPHLQNEEWKDAEKIAKELLGKFTKETEESHEAQAMRYIYLCAVAGEVGEKIITKEEGVEKAAIVKGKTVITAYNVFKAEGIFNFFSLSDEKKQWFKCFANNNGTVIYMFEYYNMINKELLTEVVCSGFEGKEMSIEAVIKNISAGGLTMPRLEVEFSEAEIFDID